MKNISPIDIHCHLTDGRYKDQDISKIARPLDFVMTAGTSEKDSLACVEIAEKFDNVYACVGIHPSDSGEVSKEYVSVIENLAKSKKVVAIGEVGLDYHWEPFDKEKQKQVFCEMCELGVKLNLPVVVHQRDVGSDVLEILKVYAGKLVFVLHCYSESVEMAREFLKIGAYFSFGGTLTYKNNKKAVETVKMLPLDRIFSETDSPYLAPEGFRGKTNYPEYSAHVIGKIAEIKEVSASEVFLQIKDNVKRVFGV